MRFVWTQLSALIPILLFCLPRGFVEAACKEKVEDYPPVPLLTDLSQLDGEWLDIYSSRLADTLFDCTSQVNTKANETSYTTSTTSITARGEPYEALFLNIVKDNFDVPYIFDLIPRSWSAHWFKGSTFFLLDFEPDSYYAWMICNDSDEYEFHISAKANADVAGVDTKVLSILDEYDLNPNNDTFHEETHYCVDGFDDGYYYLKMT